MASKVTRPERFKFFQSQFAMHKNPGIEMSMENVAAVFDMAKENNTEYYIAQTELDILKEDLEKKGINVKEFMDFLDELAKMRPYTTVLKPVKQRPPIRINSEEKIKRALVNPERDYDVVKEKMDKLVALRKEILPYLNKNLYALQIIWVKVPD